MTTLQHSLGQPRAASPTATLVAVLTWPIGCLLITGAIHFTLEAAWPDLRTTFVPAVLAPLLLAYGAWAGARMVQAGASFATAVLAGAILGLLPFALDTVGFGLILGRGTTAGLLAGLFGFAYVLFGALLGAGFVRSGR
jgi:hypothetical protein